MYQTNMYEGLLAETVIMPGTTGSLHALHGRPLGSGPYPGIGMLHHARLDECTGATRRFAHHATHHLPNLYDRKVCGPGAGCRVPTCRAVWRHR